MHVSAVWSELKGRRRDECGRRCGWESRRRSVSIPTWIPPAISDRPKRTSRALSKLFPVSVVLFSTDALNVFLVTCCAERDAAVNVAFRIFSLRLKPQEYVIMLATRCLLLWAAVTARLAVTGERRMPRWERIRDISISSIGVAIYV